MTDQIVDNEDGDVGESSVIRSLREQVRTLQSELKTRTDSPDIDAEVERRVARRDAARDVLIQLGHSPKMTNLVISNVEGDMTPQTVSSFLETIGLDAKPKEPEQKRPDPQPIASVADLASRVAAAAGSDPAKDQVMANLMEAKNSRDIDAIMRQAGLAQ